MTLTEKLIEEKGIESAIALLSEASNHRELKRNYKVVKSHIKKNINNRISRKQYLSRLKETYEVVRDSSHPEL